MFYNQSQLQILCIKLTERWEDLLQVLNVEEYQHRGRYITAFCPVHHGDNPAALTLYIEGHSDLGRWKCHTNSCHDTFTPSILGLIRGILSSQKGWSGPSDRIISFNKTLEFAHKFLGNIDLEVDDGQVEKIRFAKLSQIYNQKPSQNGNLGLTRQQVRQKLDIPAHYYIRRGFKPEILDEYDIGVCRSQSRPMYNRAVIPIYDATERLLGCTGRHINGGLPKWRHSQNFPSEYVLFNYWKAKQFIRQNNSVILVESPGNVLRLVQCGVYNVVGLFGTSLKQGQEKLLQKLDLFTINLLLDNGKAGEEGTRILQKKLSKLYDVNIIKMNAEIDDVGEMLDEKVKQEIIPQIRDYRI